MQSLEANFLPAGAGQPATRAGSIRALRVGPLLKTHFEAALGIQPIGKGEIRRRAETVQMAQPRPGNEPVHLLVDSTGLKLCGVGERLIETHGRGTRDLDLPAKSAV